MLLVPSVAGVTHRTSTRLVVVPSSTEPTCSGVHVKLTAADAGAATATTVSPARPASNLFRLTALMSRSPCWFGSLGFGSEQRGGGQGRHHLGVCLLYTSDAADERSSVDLGGR